MRTILTITALAGLFLAAACTAQPKDGQLNAEFHPPLVYPQWEAEHAVDGNGGTVCRVTTGHNGLRISIGKDSSYVEQTRRFSAGMLTTLRVNGHSYYTPEARFPASQTDTIIADLATAEKAYMEWSEVYVNGPSRNRIHTIIKLAQLRGMLKACGYNAAQ